MGRLGRKEHFKRKEKSQKESSKTNKMCMILG